MTAAPDVETSSEAYARRFSGAVGSYFLAVQASLALELLAPWPRATVLDVGGGHGQLAGPLAGAGRQVTVYGSPGASRARLAGLLDAGRIRYQAGDLLEPPWGERSFDVVLAFRLLPHLPGWRELLEALCRLARHAVVVDYPSRRSVNALAGPLFGWKRRVEGDTRSYAVFADAEIERAFAGRGFRVTGRRGQFLLPMALHRALGLAPASRALEGAAGALGLTRALGSPVILRAERG